MNWNRWKIIGKTCSYDGPAVYELRIVGIDHNPITVKRWLLEDRNGIISIGETSNMKGRLNQFVNALNRGTGHSEANLLYLLIKYSRFSSTLLEYNIEYRYKGVSSKKEAKRQEELRIKDYVKAFGEVPPLNSVIPNRFGEW